MKQVTFVTANQVKFNSAQYAMKKFALALDRAELNFVELQADGETIARYKATQAYEALQKPVVISDDTWEIPGLNGFPGSYMKEMNEWLAAEDWLRLTLSLEDRTIVLHRHITYQDANTQQYFKDTVVGTLLTDIRGANKFSHLCITSFDGGKHSRAESIELGQDQITNTSNTVWHEFAEWAINHEQ